MYNVTGNVLDNVTDVKLYPDNTTYDPSKTKSMLDEYAKSHENAWFKNPLSLRIMKDKYLHPEESTVEEFINRVCSIMEASSANALREFMISGTFFPGGRSLYGAGSKGKFNATMSNCYIMPNVEDSLDDIYESNKQIAKIFKSGGGIGINISNLRPNGSKTNNAARTSTGAVSFMNIYNTTGSIIGFHGRRGATLIGLNISHPDIEEFVNIRSKNDLKAMNISCIVDDEFMDAVLHNKKYRLHFKVKETGEEIEKWVNAKELFHKICEMNWDYGDPGMLFKDTIDRNNLMSTNKDFHIDICNPCAEYTGPAYNACNLGSLNLYNFINDPFTEYAKFDENKFIAAVFSAVTILDNILDYGYDLQPLDEHRVNIKNWRSIGLGFFGFADALIALGIPYGGDESIVFARKVSYLLMASSIHVSSIRGMEKGSFGKFDLDSLLKSKFIAELDNSVFTKNKIYNILKKNKALRNSQLISIAPTGSLSLLAGQLSSGIEPIFKCVYERTTHGMEDQGIQFQVADRAVEDLLRYHGIEPGSISSKEIKERFPFVVEAADIDPINRIRVQSAIQNYIDNAISSTINLPESATVEDIENIYTKAWVYRLKGVTVFRDNCKRASILGVKKKEENKQESGLIHMDSLHPISRRTKGPLNGRTYRKSTACVKSMYITVNRDEDGNIFEVFTNKSVHGCSANIATITRLTSLALRSGIAVEEIIQELKENACQSCQDLIKKGAKHISLSCPYAIGEVLEEEYYGSNITTDTSSTPIEKVEMKNTVDAIDDSIPKSVEHIKDIISKVKERINMVKAQKEVIANEVSNIHEKYQQEENNALECPECGERTLLVEGKCTSCKSCGYSKCD